MRKTRDNLQNHRSHLDNAMGTSASTRYTHSKQRTRRQPLAVDGQEGGGFDAVGLGRGDDPGGSSWTFEACICETSEGAWHEQ